jgi:putative hydrolase of the HAD superfamily
MGRLVESQPWVAHFQRLYFSGDLGLVKPEPEIYRHLLADLGATPAEVAFLDDRADNVEAAIQAGIKGILFTDAASARAELTRIGVPLRDR